VGRDSAVTQTGMLMEGLGFEQRVAGGLPPMEFPSLLLMVDVVMIQAAPELSDTHHCSLPIPMTNV